MNCDRLIESIIPEAELHELQKLCSEITSSCLSGKKKLITVRERL